MARTPYKSGKVVRETRPCWRGTKRRGVVTYLFDLKNANLREGKTIG
jgi:hypothetical protein